MIVLVVLGALVAGAICGGAVVLVIGICVATATREREARGGYLDFTQASREGRDASAKPDEAEGPSGGGHVTPLPHLRIVRGERENDMRTCPDRLCAEMNTPSAIHCWRCGKNLLPGRDLLKSARQK